MNRDRRFREEGDGRGPIELMIEIGKAMGKMNRAWRDEDQEAEATHRHQYEKLVEFMIVAERLSIPVNQESLPILDLIAMSTGFDFETGEPVKIHNTFINTDAHQELLKNPFAQQFINDYLQQHYGCEFDFQGPDTQLVCIANQSQQSQGNNRTEF